MHRAAPARAWTRDARAASGSNDQSRCSPLDVVEFISVGTFRPPMCAETRREAVLGAVIGVIGGRR